MEILAIFHNPESTLGWENVHAPTFVGYASRNNSVNNQSLTGLPDEGSMKSAQ